MFFRVNAFCFLALVLESAPGSPYIDYSFHINSVRQLATRTTVSGIYFQYGQKYSGSPAELIRFHCSLGF